MKKLVFDQVSEQGEDRSRIECTGALVAENGSSRVISARKEVILSAGAIASPQLLQVSGVGDCDTLRGCGVDVVRGRTLSSSNKLVTCCS